MHHHHDEVSKHAAPKRKFEHDHFSIRFVHVPERFGDGFVSALNKADEHLLHKGDGLGVMLWYTDKKRPKSEVLRDLNPDERAVTHELKSHSLSDSATTCLELPTGQLLYIGAQNHTLQSVEDALDGVFEKCQDLELAKEFIHERYADLRDAHEARETKQSNQATATR